MTGSVAQAPIPEEALTKYADKWVAVRAGEVVASADSYEELVEDQRVEITDALFHVPTDSSLFY